MTFEFMQILLLIIIAILLYDIRGKLETINNLLLKIWDSKPKRVVDME